MGEGRTIRVWFFCSCIPRPPWFFSALSSLGHHSSDGYPKMGMYLKPLNSTFKNDQNDTFCYLWGSELKSLSTLQLFAIPWTLTCQAPLSMGFSRQEYWSGFICPSPGKLPDQGIEPGFPVLQTDLHCLIHHIPLSFMFHIHILLIKTLATHTTKCTITHPI